MAFQTTQSIDAVLARSLSFRLPNNAPISSFYTLYANGAGQTYWSNSINPKDLSTLSTAIGDVAGDLSTTSNAFSTSIAFQQAQISTLFEGQAALSTLVEDKYTSSIEAFTSTLQSFSTFSTFYESLYLLQSTVEFGLSTLSTTIGFQTRAHTRC